MNLSSYIEDRDRREALQKTLNCSSAYLTQIAKSWRGKRVSPEQAIKIERATGGAVRVDELRPDVVWQRDPATGEVIGYLVEVSRAA